MDLDTKIKALKREVAFREKVYPRLVADGKKSQIYADREMAVMTEILRDYQHVKNQKPCSADCGLHHLHKNEQPSLL